MLKPFDKTSLTTQLGDISINIETGKMANQANGAALVQSGNTVVLVTAVTQTLEYERGFFPLTCNYLEMFYAAGRIPGSYFRREVGRPSERETLVSRLIDRPIRPLFPKQFRDEVQVMATVLSAGKNTNPDVLAITGASAALTISDIPFNGPIVGARVGYINDKFVLYPTYANAQEHSSLNLIFAATRDAVVMVEGAAEFVSEELVADALEWGHKEVMPLFDAQDRLRDQVGRTKIQVPAAPSDSELEEFLKDGYAAKLAEAAFIPAKMERREALSALKKEILAAVAERFPEDENKTRLAPGFLDDLKKQVIREKVRETKTRLDGRDLTTVRPLSIEVGLLPQTHGSALFRRGETSALSVATLGSTRDEQRIETLTGETTKRFMLHYNFPPYCVGEARMLRGPSRREIGHGVLAERALTPVLPDAEKFPFTMRVVSEIMESNGSSSMATVCGASLSLMDAGVPIPEPVAGIAMGLVKVEDEYLVLTDILGDEDALGDMDFKCAGSERGVTAIQMDIKISGIPSEVLRRALSQARDARMSILNDMKQVLAAPRAELSDLAPQMAVLHINPEKIRSVIGPGGKNIKAITAETEASVDIEDSGKISIFAPTLESLERTKEMVLYYDQTPKPGKNYVGTVRKILDMGALVEVLPGQEGMLHVSQMDVERVENVTDLLQLGQEVTVKVIELEPNGRIRLSRKAWLMEQAGQEIDLKDFARPAPRRDGPGGGRRDDRGGRGRPGGDRGGRR
ncbi:MAG: polyribonucleotide nucleotidyltransferase [Desulfovibrionaceae bacterium]